MSDLGGNFTRQSVFGRDLSPSNPNYASEFYKRLVEMINEFDKDLDLEHEVGMRLVSYGQTVQFHIENLGYYNPSLIRFYGSMEDGSRVELIQHVSQISFLLIAVKRLNPEEPKKPIGFNNSDEE
ncbi:DUF6173 family protein [Bacillus pseudomycoides]|uniref:DUF6173 family protein n=1 Tax=Bacillus pseudomycoides TaxID=64104 RepID=UPI002E21B886|nr:DUF6173 family protein [Bacillus pseudomycoides]